MESNLSVFFFILKYLYKLTITTEMYVKLLHTLYLVNVNAFFFFNNIKRSAVTFERPYF